MPRTAFVALGTHVPDRVVTNDELTRYMETTDAWIQERTGIQERRWVREGTDNSDLALEATQQGARPRPAGSRRTSRRSSTPRSRPTTCSRRTAASSTRSSGIPGVPAIDIRNQCTGFLYGLAVADAWIRIGMYRRILLVGSEIHSTGLDVSTRGRDVSVIFGDGAGAALLEATDEPGRGVLSCHLHADGRFATDLYCDAPGSKYHPRVQPRDDRRRARIYPRMEGQKVFKHAVVRMPEVMREALDAERPLREGPQARSSRTRRTCASARWSSASLELARRPGLQQHPAVREHHRRLDPDRPRRGGRGARASGAGISWGCAPSGPALLGRAP